MDNKQISLSLFIDEKDSKYREEMFQFLEGKGFTKDKDEFRTREEIIENKLPIRVNMLEDTYGMMGNVMCAAAAVSEGNHLPTREDLYKWLEKKKAK